MQDLTIRSSFPCPSSQAGTTRGCEAAVPCWRNLTLKDRVVKNKISHQRNCHFVASLVRNDVKLGNMQRGGAVYIVTNKSHSVLYIGVTSDLRSRIQQHREHFYKKSFSDRYNTEKLVFYELFGSIEEAIAREKEIKKWRREKKDALIQSMNPEWNDLWEVVKEW